MKTTILILLILPFISTLAQKNIIPMSTELKEVTVFLSGVQVERQANITLPEGNSLVVVTGLPSDILPQTIQVSGKGDFTILSVTNTTNFLVEQTKPKDILALEDSIQRLKDLIAEKNNQLYVYSQEEAFLMANKELGGQQNGVNVTALKEATDYFRNRLMDIKNKQLFISKQVSELQKRIARFESQLNEKHSKNSNPTSEILISVWASKSTPAVFNIKYISSLASWYPSYDIKVKDINHPVQLVYKANIQQRTGEDWKGIKMTISTANPFQVATKPAFKPWYLSYYQPVAYNYERDSYRKSKSNLAQAPMEMKTEVSPTDDLPMANRSYELAQQQTNLTTVEFVINKPYDILSNGQTVAVEMSASELTAQYEYFAYPKANLSAFLLAKVTGWESLNMLPGEMFLYFENTFVGKSEYTGVAVSDTLDFSLGQDKSISIKREKIKEFSSRKIIGLNQHQSIGFKISIRNNKNIPIVINLFEQLPISTNKDIEVERIEMSNAQINDVNGLVYWKFQLKPGESKELKFAYTVKYPKDKTIILE